MRTKVFGIALGALFLALSLPAEAQEPGRVYRIGFLSNRFGPLLEPSRLAFRQGLLELGYVEGQNLVVEYRAAEGKPERFPGLAAELVRLKADVIVTTGSGTAIRAVQQATTTIPIVMAGVNVDPVKAGFVASLARPGGNLTGLTSLQAELHVKRLEVLKEAFPRVFHVAILWPRTHEEQRMKEVEAAGRALGIQIQSVAALRFADLESAFSAISREKPNALLVARFGLTRRYRVRVIDFATERRLPTIYADSLFVSAGGLMSYSPDRVDIRRRAATYVDKILKGAKPGELPIEQPTKFELVVNLKAARQIGLTIPPSLLYRADKVIK